MPSSVALSIASLGKSAEGGRSRFLRGNLFIPYYIYKAVGRNDINMHENCIMKIFMQRCLVV